MSWREYAIYAYLRMKAETDDTPQDERERYLREAVRNFGILIRQDLTGVPVSHDSCGDPFIEFAGLRIYAQRVDWWMHTKGDCWPQILVRCPGCGWEYLSRPIRNPEDLGSVLVWMRRRQSERDASDDHAACDCIEVEEADRPHDERERP